MARLIGIDFSTAMLAQDGETAVRINLPIAGEKADICLTLGIEVVKADRVGIMIMAILTAADQFRHHGPRDGGVLELISRATDRHVKTR